MESTLFIFVKFSRAQSTPHFEFASDGSTAMYNVTVLQTYYTGALTYIQLHANKGWMQGKLDRDHIFPRRAYAR